MKNFNIIMGLKEIHFT